MARGAVGFIKPDELAEWVMAQGMRRRVAQDGAMIVEYCEPSMDDAQ